MLRLHASLARPIDALVAVPLPDDMDARFRRFFELLQSHPPVDKTAQRTVQRVHDVREGIRAAVYHQRNVESLECAIVPVCQAAYSQGPPVTKPITMSFGAPGMTAEYHAFLFALRRSFEYLNGALIVYFGRGSKSFRQLPKALNGAEPSEVAEALAEKTQNALRDFEDVFGEGDTKARRKAPRDRVAHQTPEVPAVINVEFKPSGEVCLRMVDGAESLPFPAAIDPAQPQLSALLTQRIDRLGQLVFELLGELPLLRNAVQAALPIKA
jgi:hypothetical protein